MQKTFSGVIPNASRAEQMVARNQATLDRSSSRVASELRSGTLFGRKRSQGANGGLGRRTKSLTKGHWDEIVFNGTANAKYPAYERVTLRQAGFLRWVWWSDCFLFSWPRSSNLVFSLISYLFCYTTAMLKHLLSSWLPHIAICDWLVSSGRVLSKFKFKPLSISYHQSKDVQ